MVGLSESQHEAGKQGFPNWMLVVVLLVEFVIEGDLCMKDATCQVDSKGWNLIWPNITQNDLILLNITPGPWVSVALTIFPSLLICFLRLAGRSNGSSSGISICPVVLLRPAEGPGVELRASWAWPPVPWCGFLFLALVLVQALRPSHARAQDLLIQCPQCPLLLLEACLPHLPSSLGPVLYGAGPASALAGAGLVEAGTALAVEGAGAFKAANALQLSRSHLSSSVDHFASKGSSTLLWNCCKQLSNFIPVFFSHTNFKLLNDCDALRSVLNSTNPAAAKWPEYAVARICENLKRSNGMEPSLYTSHLVKIECCIFECSSNTVVKESAAAHHHRQQRHDQYPKAVLSTHSRRMWCWLPFYFAALKNWISNRMKSARSFGHDFFLIRCTNSWLSFSYFWTISLVDMQLSSSAKYLAGSALLGGPSSEIYIYVISVSDRNQSLSFTKHEEVVCISFLIGFERLYCVWFKVELFSASAPCWFGASTIYMQSLCSKSMLATSSGTLLFEPDLKIKESKTWI